MIHVRAVDADQRGHVGDRAFRQATGRGWKEHVPGRRRERSVTGDHDTEGGGEAASVVRVGLNDRQRPPLPGAAASRLHEVGPADISATGHQSAPSTLNVVRARSAASALLWSVPPAASSAALIRSVIESASSSSK